MITVPNDASLVAVVARLNAGMTVVDVGANVGLYTATLLECVRPGGHVYAIEPGRVAYSRGLAATPAATWLHCAVSDRDAEAPFYRGTRSAQCSLYPPNVPDATIQADAVATWRIDTLIAEGRLPATIDVMKVDVQGAEVAALRGAPNLLAQHHAVWVLECWPWGLRNAGESVRTLLDVLASAGLSVSMCDDPAQDDAAILAASASMMAHESFDIVAVPQGAPI